jgi:hypothetical protein
MKMGTAFISAVLASYPIISFSKLLEDQQHKFDEAERRIVRLSPRAFGELPGNVVQELQRRGCTIPQESYSKRRNNVIKGRFAKPGQTDWAVLKDAHDRRCLA